ncbi:MAG: hypothetical protein ACD_36C00090G0002 [uncultured bacterium]|uniref:Protein-export membrane protein SecF n=1 Tax=Candidatus Gottesmanbacteria bacterium RIFCSPLOWO2_01_FULL_43_11b TaxID=1798392 RepID=A0A1F6AHW7_9BACT|nr:MAG: hypothetical protein ACD_36C00090G0002 [uncultured bacterium]OGG24329.1 MAG: hypothetical protein A3A79_04050 [Candidatus Gottesmanbacteria bacterium RIFCSPLOWO2_01_FULL_43_11b]
MIRFSKYIWLYFLLSALILVPGIFSLVRFGLRPAVDFTGGTLIEIRKDDKISTLRLKHGEDQNIDLNGAEVLRSETVGPILGKELLRKAAVASVLAVVAILLYVALAFKNFKFGICAVVALAHDLLVVIGLFSLFGRFWGVEVDTLFVTAVLTTMSFSVHDTIVIFDRIREYRKRGERQTFSDISDRALTETMNRSLTNSMTIIFMLLALILLGGSTIRWFIVALLIGTVSGTYSSPFVATPLLILWERLEMKRRQV